MSSDTSSTVVPGDRTDGHWVTTELVFRFTLAALAVAICYCFDWRFLRTLTLDLNLWLDSLFGVHLQQISSDTVMYNGALYRYVIACTMADVWCGAIPLIWNLRSRVGQNLRFIGVFTVALFAFNIIRLSLSDVLFAYGLSWNLAHNVVSGVAYYLIWIFVWKRTRQLVALKPANPPLKPELQQV
jgi:hypothetical protein